MADVHTKAQRSYNMSRIKGRDTKPEILVRSYLHRQGFRFRLHAKELPGKPDIVLPKYKTVIFVHGCFWHGHNCKCASLPKTRRNWWKKKIDRNKQNDIKALRLLKRNKLKTIVIWTCRLREKKKAKTLSRLVQMLV